MPSAILITSLPHFISRDEHKVIAAQTPVSFSDIPPVLRHKEEHVSATLDPPLAGFSAEDTAQGTLFVLESVLVFMSDATGRGIQIEYPAITLHAVSRAGAHGASIYCQLDEHAGEPEGAAANDEMGDMCELWLAPQDAASLDPIFEALSKCAALHPDKATPSDEDEDPDDAFVFPEADTQEDDDADEEDAFQDADEEDAAAGPELSAAGRATLAHLESLLDFPDEQPNTAVNADGPGKGASADATAGKDTEAI
ncbi:regulator of volume decrease after cellular swelling-domain-containing protein [Mycena rebaudengoi]|nr:regulator of volume decrease after cellular swelling-domain-containing protein [Mycena rebaudengoi]